MVKKKNQQQSLSQQPALGTQIVAAASLHGFSQTGDLFAVVVPAPDRPRLRVWDVVTGKLRLEVEHPTQSRDFTSLAWGTTPLSASGMPSDDEAKTPNKKDRKRKRDGEAGVAGTTPVVALGCDDGTIAIVSVAAGGIVRTLTGSASRRINDIVFSDDGHTAYSSSEDGIVSKWNFVTGKEESQWKADPKSVKAICLHQGGYIFSANIQLKVWDIATHSLIKTFPGHATPVFSLQSASSFVISAAESDRFLSAWEISGDGAVDDASAFGLSMTSSPVSLRARDSHVLTVNESGEVNIWDLSSAGSASSSSSASKKTIKSRKPGCTIKGSSILAVDRDLNGKAVVACGEWIKPSFQIINYVEEGSNNLIEQIQLASVGKQLLLPEKNLGPSITPNNNKVKKAPSEKISSAGPAHTTVKLASSNKAQEKSLGERMNELPDLVLPPLAAPSKAVADVNNSGRVNSKSASSLSTMLAQALHSEDNQLLDECLAVGDANVIQNTMRRLPTQYVLPFLTAVIHRFMRSPTRGTAMVKWLKAVLLAHTAYLITVPNLVSQLGGLYQAVDSRLSAFRKLLRLSGRLDLVMSQITLRSQADAGVDGAEEPATVYEEGEEDEQEGADATADLVKRMEGADLDDADFEVNSEDDFGWNESEDDEDDDDDHDEDDDDADEDMDQDEDDADFFADSNRSSKKNKKLTKKRDRDAEESNFEPVGNSVKSGGDDADDDDFDGDDDDEDDMEL